MVHCYVADCDHNSMRDICKFFRFPKNQLQRDLWLAEFRLHFEFLGTVTVCSYCYLLLSLMIFPREPGREPKPNCRVCSCHFNESLLERGIKNPSINSLIECPSPPQEKRTASETLSPNSSAKIALNKVQCFFYCLPPHRSEQENQRYSVKFLSQVVGSSSTSNCPSKTFTQAESTSSANLMPLSDLKEKEKEQKREQRQVTEEISEEEIREANTTETPLRKVDRECQTLLTATDPCLVAENYLLKLKVEKLENQMQEMKDSKRFGISQLENNDNYVKYYTGFPTYRMLQIFINIFKDLDINYYLKWSVHKIEREDQIFITLLKLRVNYGTIDLARQFDCSQATISNIIITWIHVFHEVLVLDLFKEIPSVAKNKACLPPCFTDFNNCRIVIDCTEVFVDTPHNLTLKKKTYSNYKHSNTFKGLVGVAPNGVPTFSSQLFPGSTSDKEIVRNCGLLEKLKPGDLVLADKGFLITDIVPPGVEVNIPPFLMTPQFTPHELHVGKKIAQARIHVERAIGRVKYFQILRMIPRNLFFYSSKIFQVCVALTAFRFPLLKELESTYDRLAEVHVQSSNTELTGEKS
ncbi:uncharacterized protein [Bemisia tabaci]|uniref:uncharacterized protein n=1 Tax=Bemisia tabaci TaxID=7038 RepID=UPI003B27EB2A